MKLTSAPRLSATMRESPMYRVMGVGLTDTLFLLAHHGEWDEEEQDIKGPIKLNTPLPVSTVQEAIDALGADADSPLLIAMMEAYFSGARDIWLVAAAPMDEYEPDIEERDEAYYETYRDRLNATYDVIKYWDIAQITVPVDAPFNSTVDFLGPLVNYCIEAFVMSGDIHLAVMGTRGPIDSSMVDALVSDGRLAIDQTTGESVLGSAGKFVSVFVGDGTYQLKEMPRNHTSSVAVAVAAEMAQLPLDRGMTYKNLRNVINTLGADLSKEDINRLAEARLNYVGRSIIGRRNNPFETICFTDNTLAWEGSDFWSLAQTRLITAVSAEIRSMGMRRLGTIGYDLFRNQVEEYMLNLVEQDVIKSYDMFIRRDHLDKGLVLIDIDLTPFFGIRELHVGTVVGPSQ